MNFAFVVPLYTHGPPLRSMMRFPDAQVSFVLLSADLRSEIRWEEVLYEGATWEAVLAPLLSLVVRRWPHAACSVQRCVGVCSGVQWCAAGCTAAVVAGAIAAMHGGCMRGSREYLSTINTSGTSFSLTHSRLLLAGVRSQLADVIGIATRSGSLLFDLGGPDGDQLSTLLNTIDAEYSDDMLRDSISDIDGFIEWNSAGTGPVGVALATLLLRARLSPLLPPSISWADLEELAWQPLHGERALWEALKEPAAFLDRYVVRSSHSLHLPLFIFTWASARSPRCPTPPASITAVTAALSLTSGCCCCSRLDQL